MKIRALTRMTLEYQVVECEIEMEIENKSDIQEAFANLQQETITASTLAIQRTLGQKKALENQRKSDALKGLL